VKRRRYGGYHGRVTGRDVFRLVLALFLILLVLAAAGLMIGQRYLIYTDEGVRLELPFFGREEASSQEASVSAQIVQLPRPESGYAAEDPLPESE